MTYKWNVIQMRNNQYNPFVLLFGAAVKRIYKIYDRFREWRFLSRERKRFAEAGRKIMAAMKEVFESEVFLMTRMEILKTAEKIISGEREKSYGAPEDNFSRIADLWNAYIRGKDEYEITAADVGHMMILFKIARTLGGQSKDDNYVDIAGYAAIAGELSESPKKF